MTIQPLVSIMILGWNNYEDVINCLKSLKAINYKNYNIVLVDNGSKEENFQKFALYLKRSKTQYDILGNQVSKMEPRRQESAAPPVLRRAEPSEADPPSPRLREDYPVRIHPQTGVWGILRRRVKKSKLEAGRIFIIKSKRNLGFTGGSNLGLRFTWRICDPKYLLLLNGDTLVTKDFLEKLVEACQKDKKIGSAQSALIRFDRKTIDSLGLEMVGYKAFDSHGGEARSALDNIDEGEEIFGACGASALYRADLIKRIGLFDEDLFATCEDFDLAWRIRLANYKSVLVKTSTVYHRGGVSRYKKDHVIFDLKSYYMAKNLLVIFNRYYPINVGVVGISLIRIVIGLVSALKNHRIREFLTIIYSFPKQRQEIAKNKCLKEIQRQWIK